MWSENILVFQEISIQELLVIHWKMKNSNLLNLFKFIKQTHFLIIFQTYMWFHNKSNKWIIHFFIFRAKIIPAKKVCDAKFPLDMNSFIKEVRKLKKRLLYMMSLVECVGIFVRFDIIHCMVHDNQLFVNLTF